MSHSCASNVEKESGEDMPEWRMVWQLYLTERALHGITTRVCAAPGRTTQLDYMKSPRAKNLQLNPSENERPVHLLEEHVAMVRRTRGTCTRSKLSLCAGTRTCPFMCCTHSVRPPLYFNDALFLLVTVSRMCNFCAQG